MPRTLQQVMATFPEDMRERIERRAEEIDREVTLCQLGLTQKDLARKLNVSQGAISQQERRGDMQLSTLCEVVRAMGGEVEIIARFPSREPVRLTGIFPSV
mgnify:CR=1 FL=1